MARNLDADLATLRQVLAYAEQRDFVRAAQLAEATLASGFEHPLLLNVMATHYETRGRFEDSLRLLERAVKIAPRDVGARNALSLCLQRLERPGDALAHVDELLRQNPGLAFAHANRGNALIALGALGQARASHLRALELEPGNLVATVALASIASHRGEHAAARYYAEQALAKAPGFPDAVLSLAAAELADGNLVRAESQLHGLILDSRASRLDKARASGVLGDVLDAMGRHAEAFASYAECNASLRQHHARYADGSSILAYTLALTEALDRLGARDLAASSAPDPGVGGAGAPAGHAFLLGFPRSGTTLLEVALEGHPAIVSSEEHELLTDGVLRYMCEPLDLAPLARASEEELAPLRAAYWAGIRRAGIDVAGKIFLDKHPMHTLKLPLIARLFPRAKILFAVRDPRDVVLGCFRRRFLMNPAVYQFLTLSGAADFYAAVMQFAARALPLVDMPWREVRYERLVADLAAETRAICAFLGLDWVEGLDRFAERAAPREHATPSSAQLSRGLSRDVPAPWRRYSQALAPVLPVLRPWALRFGYAPE
jgi:tetratricopeptide (TPR) repeat protein